jgi:hypothetical protein
MRGHVKFVECRVVGSFVLPIHRPLETRRNPVHIGIMPNKPPKRPRDPAQLPKLMIDIASGEVSEDRPAAKETRASKAGTKGGPARAKALTQEQRSEIARTLAAARWKKSV